MDIDDDILEALANNGSMDYSQWPSLLERILPRLDQIIHNDFPIPSIPLPEPLPPLPTSTKEPDPSSTKASPPTTPSPKPTTISPPPSTLPPPLLSLIHSIRTTLQTTFPTSPPHTAQRLAELLLHPKTHYRTLPSYLRALDRVISVSSPLTDFPLPTAAAPLSSTFRTTTFLNGTTTPPTSTIPTENNDPTTTTTPEDFNGAQLTPIPWLLHSASPPRDSHPDLRTESTRQIDGPNGAGSLETVTVTLNGLAPQQPSPSSNPAEQSLQTQQQQPQQQNQQQQQQHSPTTTTTRITRSTSLLAKKEEAAEEESSLGEEASEEIPHARGPELIGMEDMGPQATGRRTGGFDVEAALGRRGGNRQVLSFEEEGERGDGDGDILIADADGKAGGGV
ncbi:hypothetical protein MMC12_006485 [Toensbergia leucococca]|nr:hypothetical protein [Toensbergia leucococca]